MLAALRPESCYHAAATAAATFAIEDVAYLQLGAAGCEAVAPGGADQLDSGFR